MRGASSSHPRHASSTASRRASGSTCRARTERRPSLMQRNTRSTRVVALLERGAPQAPIGVGEYVLAPGRTGRRGVRGELGHRPHLERDAVSLGMVAVEKSVKQGGR